MAYNGSGVFSIINTFVYDTVISETAVNQNFTDIATGLSTAITKDGQTTVTANIPMSTNKFTGLAAGSAATDSATLGQVQAKAYAWGGTAAGTADALTITPSPAIAAYAAGQRFSVLINATNTTAATIAVSGLAAKAIQKLGAALVAGDMTASDVADIEYDGTQFQMLSPARTPVLTANSIPGSAVAIATATTRGSVEFATTAETETGTDAALSVTPDGLHDMTTLAGAAWFLDEDAMGSDSAVKVASQQSIKAYVAAQVAAVPTLTLGTEQATTSGTVIDFTSIPTGTKRITVMFVDVSLSGSDELLVQLGDAGGVEATGYVASCGSGANVDDSTAGLIATEGGAASSAYSGAVVLNLEDASGFTWVSSGILNTSAAIPRVSAGRKSLTAELDRIRITTNGSDTFDAGAINISYE